MLRQFISHSASYETFVGQLTPEEFLVGSPKGDSDRVRKAVCTYIGADWPWEEKAPTWLEASLIEYIDSELEGLENA